MITFRTFLLEAEDGSVRQGLPHIHTMLPDHFGEIIKTGSIDIGHNGVGVVQKTDGLGQVEYGYDDHPTQPFFIRTKATTNSRTLETGEHKVRPPLPDEEGKIDYEAPFKKIFQEKATDRHPYNPDKTETFGNILRMLHQNKQLGEYMATQHHVTGKEVKIGGEVLYKPLSKEAPGHPDTVRTFVNTAYDTSNMGTGGMLVIHTANPMNAQHRNNLEALRATSTPELKIGVDTLPKFPPVSIKVPQHITDRFKQIDRELIGRPIDRSLSRQEQQEHKRRRDEETQKYNSITNEMSGIVTQHIRALEEGGHLKGEDLSGPEIEGIVVKHPSGGDYKIISPRFAEDMAKGRVEWKKQSK